jgi:hypothetical protein
MNTRVLYIVGSGLLMMSLHSASLAQTVSANSSDGASAVTMSTPTSQMPERTIYEYGRNQRLFPRRIVITLVDVLEDGAVIGRIPSTLRVIGCAGPRIQLKQKDFAQVSGFFRGVTVSANDNGSGRCNTRHLQIAFETSRFNNLGNRVNAFYSVRIAQDGTMALEIEEMEANSQLK